MKLKEILDMEYYLANECYCPGEIYSIDGFCYQVFKPETECKEIGRIDTFNNYFSKIPCIFVTGTSIHENAKKQILIIMYEDNKIEDIIRFDATENNINLIKEVIEKGVTELKFNHFSC